MVQDTKKERFKRLAEKRANNIIKSIRILANCSNRSSYEYTKDEVNKIFNAISHELRKAKAQFTFKDENPNGQVFKL